LPHCPDIVKKCFNTLAHTFDPVHGGFGKAPKFPQPGKRMILFGKGCSGVKGYAKKP